MLSLQCVDSKAALKQWMLQSNDRGLLQWMQENKVWDKKLFEALTKEQICTVEDVSALSQNKFDDIVRGFRVQKFSELKEQKARRKMDKKLVRFEKLWRSLAKSSATATSHSDMASPQGTKNPFAEIGRTKIKLKKTKNINDQSGPKLTGFLTEQEIAEYDQYIKSFDIESWYETLKELTFPTEYIKIGFKEGQSLHALCQRVLEINKALAITDDDAQKNGLLAELRNLDLTKISDLQSRIDAVIDRWRPKRAALPPDGGDEKQPNHNEEAAEFGVFAKLSSRSAKDATDAEQRLQALFQKYCAESNAEDDNDRIAALIEAATHCMKVSSAQQILSMFIHSERIHHDLGSALKYGAEAFDQNVVIRRWIPIAIDMEFRGFVCNGKLTALSQYNHFIRFDRLVKMKDALAEQIQNFFAKKVAERLKHYDGYIVDFAVCGEDLGDILIIELNPFTESTDPGLFSWKTERDLLQNGPFEFRIRSEKPDGPIAIEYKYRVLLGWEQ